jgi:hypothetical protein
MLEWYDLVYFVIDKVQVNQADFLHHPMSHFL